MAITLNGNSNVSLLYSSGGRITGDFTNATLLSRAMFQTSTADSTTGIYALPSGTSTAASWQATNNADPTNASKVLIATNGTTDCQLVSGRNGSGTYLPLSFYTNGSQQMQLDTNGNLGLAATISPWGSGSNGTINVPQSGGLVSTGLYANLGTNYYYNSGFKYSTNGGAAQYSVGPGTHTWSIAGNNTSGAGATLNFTTAMTLDASGNLGIGLTSPSAKLAVSTFYSYSDGNNGSIRIQDYNTTVSAYIDRIGSLSIYDASNYYGGGLRLAKDTTSSGTSFGGGNITFYSNTGLTAGNTYTPTERARIDSSGNLLVGATSSFGAGVQSKTTSASLQSFTAWNAVDSGQAYLFYGGTGSASFTARYQIYWNFTGGTGTAGFLSDYRQKDNVRRLTNGLDAIKALKPSIYRFKDALEDASGFIAHEVQEVIPQAVSGHKDEVDEDGNPKYQMLDQTHIIPYLTAAIQELTTRLEALEAK